MNMRTNINHQKEHQHGFHETEHENRETKHEQHENEHFQHRNHEHKGARTGTFKGPLTRTLGQRH